MLYRDKGAVLLDLEGRIAYASTYFCELVGVQVNEAVGKPCFDFVYPEDEPGAHRLIKGVDTAFFRFRLKRQDGSPVWVDVKAAPMQTAGGETFGVTATVTLATMEDEVARLGFSGGYRG